VDGGVAPTRVEVGGGNLAKGVENLVGGQGRQTRVVGGVEGEDHQEGRYRGLQAGMVVMGAVVVPSREAGKWASGQCAWKVG
jgi:hypothetical protein